MLLGGWNIGLLAVGSWEFFYFYFFLYKYIFHLQYYVPQLMIKKDSLEFIVPKTVKIFN